MSSPGGESGIAGPLFGLVVTAVMFWLAVGFLTSPVPVAAWFRRRLESSAAVAPFGGGAAAKNATPGQLTFFAISTIVLAGIIVLNVAPRIAGVVDQSGDSGISAVALIFAGPAGIVGGVIITLRSVGRDRQRTTAAGVLLVLAGGVSLVAGVVFVLASTNLTASSAIL